MNPNGLTLPDEFTAPHGLTERVIRRIVLGESYHDQLPQLPRKRATKKYSYQSDPALIVRSLLSRRCGPGMRNSYR